MKPYNPPVSFDPLVEAYQRLTKAVANLKDAQRREAIAIAEIQAAVAYLKEVSK